MMHRLLALALTATVLFAQRSLDYDYSVVSQVRIDARDLGYPPVDVVPPDESAVRALAVAPDGTLYGATSGKRSHLFALFPAHGYVQPLCSLKDVATVHRSLVISAQGDVYIGAGQAVDNDGQGYGNYPGGALLKYSTRNDEKRPIRIGADCEAVNLGVPVRGESIYTLAIDRERGVIYGLTYPKGHFFSYDIAAAKFAVHGRVAERKIPGEKFENELAIARALAVDRSGRVFLSGEDGFLLRYNPHDGKLEKLPLRVPTVRGREAYNRVDAWAEDASGVLYGGSSDGYLFRLDPKTMRLENLGKPLNQYRIRGLAFLRDGRLYGVGGDDDEMARLFSYDPARGSYQMLGMIDVNRRPYYSWQAFVVDAVAVGLDETIYLGQSERKSKLYLYYPEPRR